MKKTEINLTREEALLKARKEGLENVGSLNSMKAHGKVLGMDTFSWINPPMDSLKKVIASFPFSVIWLASINQLKDGTKVGIGINEKLNTLVIYDQGNLPPNSSLLHSVKNVMCVDGLEEALNFIKAAEKKKMVLLFTSEEDKSKEGMDVFNKWIADLK